MKCFLQTIETPFSFVVYVEQKEKCSTIKKDKKENISTKGFRDAVFHKVRFKKKPGV